MLTPMDTLTIHSIHNSQTSDLSKLLIYSPDYGAEAVIILKLEFDTKLLG